MHWSGWPVAADTTYGNGGFLRLGRSHGPRPCDLRHRKE